MAGTGADTHLEYEYTKDELLAMKHRGQGSAVTIQAVFSRECREAGIADASFPRSKEAAAKRVLSMQRARLAQERSAGADSRAEAEVAGEATAAARIRRGRAAASPGAAAASVAGAAASPPTTPKAKPGGASHARSGSGSSGPAGAAGPPAAAASASAAGTPASPKVKAKYKAASVCKATRAVARKLARELGVAFLDADDVYSLRELVLLKAHGFDWDNVARAAAAEDPHARFGETTPGLGLGLFVGRSQVRRPRLMFCEQQLGLPSRPGAHSKTRTHAIAQRVLDRMVARRDGTPIPGAEPTRGRGEVQGGVSGLAAATMPPGTDVKPPLLKHALSAAASDRVSDAASPEHPRAGRFVRIGSWNLRRFSVAGLDTRDIGHIVARLSRFDVVCLLEVFSGALGTAEEAVRGVCERLDDLVGRPGAWRFVLSPSTEEGGKASDGAAGGERSAIVWRADSTVCTSRGRPPAGAAASADAGPPAGLSFAATAEEDLASRYFARPPFYASFRTGRVDYVVVAYHAVWDGRARSKPRHDAARELEFRNLAVGIDSLRRRMRDAADGLAASGDKARAEALRWSPVFVCGDFNAELLSIDQQSLFDPLLHIGGESVHSGLQPTVVAGEADKSHAFDMVWVFPALATVEAVRWRNHVVAAAEEGGADESEGPAEEGTASPAEEPAGYGSARMVMVEGHGVEDVMGAIRANLVESEGATATASGSFGTPIEPKAEAVAAMNEVFSRLGVPFASHSADRPDVQAKALLAIARTLVSSAMSDHVPVWVEIAPTHAIVSSTAGLAPGVEVDDELLDDETPTPCDPPSLPLPHTRLDLLVDAGRGPDGSPRPPLGSRMYSD